MIAVTLAGRDALAAVAAFYAAVGYGGGIASSDLTLCAHVDGKLAGVVRLCPEHGVTVLRGMQVHPAFQRQGIGRLLLTHCAPHLDQGTAYCLPYDHLTQFYAGAGFHASDALPAFLAQRLQAYLASGQKLLAMKRHPVPN